MKLTPGKHYCVKDFSGYPDVIAFPADDKALSTFRNRWVMVRHRRPMVPIFARSRLPRPGLAAEENARLCSVYLRPWTLNKRDAGDHVPHLLQLAQLPQLPTTRTVVGRRLRRKTDSGLVNFTSTSDVPIGDGLQAASWSEAWKWYVHGNVVSDHAARIITNFLTSTLARTAEQDDSSGDDRDDEAGTRDCDAVGPLCPSLDNLHNILRTQVDVHGQDGKVTRASQEHARTIQRSRLMWAQGILINMVTRMCIIGLLAPFM